jgi:hypothetical protein
MTAIKSGRAGKLEMDYRKDSRLQIIIVCVVLALLLAWYFRPMQHQTVLAPTAAPISAEAPAKPATPDQPK